MAYQIVEGLAVAGIMKRLVSAGIHAIPVTESIPESGDERVAFEGTFDDYLAALTAIGINHALVCHFELAQKAMLQYALQCIPELRDLDSSFLKAEIQDMRARIDVGSA